MRNTLAAMPTWIKWFLTREAITDILFGIIGIVMIKLEGLYLTLTMIAVLSIFISTVNYGLILLKKMNKNTLVNLNIFMEVILFIAVVLLILDPGVNQIIFINVVFGFYGLFLKAMNIRVEVSVAGTEIFETFKYLSEYLRMVALTIGALIAIIANNDINTMMILAEIFVVVECIVLWFNSNAIKANIL